ncbi:MAG: hypothetical protein WC531_02690 [Candidatus Paceibacterota bacterium]
MTSNGSPYSDGLPEVDGIPWYKESKILTIPELSQRASKDETMLNRLVDTQGKLQQAREEAFQKSSRWKVKVWASAVANVLNEDDPESVFYNTKRLNIIDAMLTNVDLKLTFLLNDIANCNYRISEIRLEEAKKTNNEELIENAQKENQASLAEMRDTRINIQQKLAEIKANHDASTCWSFTGGLNIGVCILQATGWIGNMITSVFSLLLWVASGIFDLSIRMSIIDIREWFGKDAVSTVWRLLRDMANLCFIFILLYIALGTVFEIPGMGDVKKMIVGVVTAALLVNFSGFFTRVVIDASNIIAYEFYTQIKGDSGSISTELAKKMRLGDYFISASTQAEAEDSAQRKFIPPQVNRLNFTSIIAGTFGNIIIILVTSFILLTAAILFVIRTIHLLFLYVSAPIIFASMAIPKFNYFTKWKDTLIKQAFFAPAFLIPLYLVLILLGPKGITDIAGGVGGGPLTVVMLDAVIIGLLLGCITIANKFGATGAKWATGVAGASTLIGARAITKYGGGVAKYTGSKLGRGAWNVTGGTAGRWAQRISNETNAANQAGEASGFGPEYGNKPNFLRRVGSRAILETKATGETVAGASKWAWNTKPVKEVRGSDFGKKIKSAVKNPLLTANDWIVNAQSMSGGGGSYSFLGKTSKERKDAEKDKNDAKEKEDREKIEKTGNDLKNANVNQAREILGGLTPSQVEQLPPDVLTRDDVAQNLSWDDLDALAKKKKLTRDQKIAIKKSIFDRAPREGENASGYEYMTSGPGKTAWEGGRPPETNNP